MLGSPPHPLEDTCDPRPPQRLTPEMVFGEVNSSVASGRPPRRIPTTINALNEDHKSQVSHALQEGTSDPRPPPGLTPEMIFEAVYSSA